MKQDNGVDVVEDLANAVAYVVCSDDFKAPPAFYMPENCYLDNPMDRLKNKVKYFRQQFEIYKTCDKATRADQFSYLVNLSLMFVDDENKIYFDQYGGVSYPLEDPRYKVDLFASYGGNNDAFVKGLTELLDDMDASLISDTKEKLYFAVNNLVAFIIDTYTQLYSTTEKQPG